MNHWKIRCSLSLKCLLLINICSIFWDHRVFFDTENVKLLISSTILETHHPQDKNFHKYGEKSLMINELWLCVVYSSYDWSILINYLDFVPNTVYSSGASSGDPWLPPRSSFNYAKTLLKCLLVRQLLVVQSHLYSQRTPGENAQYESPL